MYLVFALVGFANAARLRGPSQPRCVDSLVRVHPTATNFDLRGLDVTQNALPDNTPTFNVSGTFNIQVRFCEPTVHIAHRADTLQIFAPGATYNTVYWDIGFQPETYSYVRFAAAQGYATLNIARLGGYPCPRRAADSESRIEVSDGVITLTLRESFRSR